MKTKDKEYISYGEEWKDELMKLPKIMIINMYRNVCLEKDELNQAYQQACNEAGLQQERAKDAEREIRNILNDIER
jgi:hypothetical protein